ncbi:MAG: alpha/beta fold hydrolase [Planctomycetota bacterium]
MIRRLLTLLILCTAAPAHAEEPFKDFVREFAGLGTSWERAALVSGVDPTATDAEKILSYVLEQPDWFVRHKAIAVWLHAEDEAVIAKLKKLANKKGAVAEGAALALTRSSGIKDPTFFTKLLKSRDWKQRRAAVLGLSWEEKVESVDALLAAWPKEKVGRVRATMLEALERLTGHIGTPVPEDWEKWWQSRRANFKFGESGDIEGREEARLRGTRVVYDRRGTGPPLLVLAEYWYQNDYLVRYLRELEETNQLLYVKLPTKSDFEAELPIPDGYDRPDWPIKRLADAFASLHSQLVAEGQIEDEPFAVLAHGLSCWVAMTYADLHPERVRRQILISPYSGTKAWLAGRDRIESIARERNDDELLHYARSELWEGGRWQYVAKDEVEQRALFRRRFTLYFADPADHEVGRLLGPGFRNMHRLEENSGYFFIPNFELSSLQKVPVPTLVIHGDRSQRTSFTDAVAVARHYGKAGRALRYSKSARMPFIEEADRFTKDAKKFLKMKKKRKKRSKD